MPSCPVRLGSVCASVGPEPACQLPDVSVARAEVVRRDHGQEEREAYAKDNKDTTPALHLCKGCFGLGFVHAVHVRQGRQNKGGSATTESPSQVNHGV